MSFYVILRFFIMNCTKQRVWHIKNVDVVAKTNNFKSFFISSTYRSHCHEKSTENSFYHSRRAKLYEENDKLDESLEDFKKVLELDSNCTEARQAIVRLPVKINERNEKLKEEMLGKLKDLGNMILKPFGLSTNNFQMQQDPSTGSYSVNFNQNAKPWYLCYK